MLLDVSQPVTPRTAGFPGDEPFSCGWTATLAAGAPVNVGWVKTSPHVGTHVDAPYHYSEGGKRLGQLDVEAFVGPSLVVDATGRDALDADLLRGLDLAASPRVLFKTRERSDLETFHDRFPVLTGDAVALLARHRVRLVGVDVPSVDPADSKDLRVHHLLGRAGIVNVENLMLDGVAAGRYELLAAPVRWTDLDAAPLRALLRR
jgi:arylformamidase